jgi:hypothetical protein
LAARPTATSTCVEGNAHFLPGMFGNQDLLAVFNDEFAWRVVDQHIYPVSDKALHDQFGNLRVFAQQQMRAPISTCVTWLPRRAKVCVSSEPIGPPPSTTRRLGSSRRFHTLSEVRQPTALNAGNRRHEGLGAGGNDDAARAQALRAAVARVISTSHGETILAVPCTYIDAQPV